MLVLLAFACAPDDATPPPSAEPAPPDQTSSDVEVDRGTCPDYLACVAAVAPDALDVVELVGVEGSCWADPQAAEGCRSLCEEELELLARANPDEPECGVVEVEELPFQPGDWTLVYTAVDDPCGIGLDEAMGVPLGVSLLPETNDWFTMTVGLVPADCELDGDAYTCEHTAIATYTYEGVFLSPDSGNGTHTLTWENCSATAAYTLTRK